jgi:hypothetical protein
MGWRLVKGGKPILANLLPPAVVVKLHNLRVQ